MEYSRTHRQRADHGERSSNPGMSCERSIHDDIQVESIRDIAKLQRSVERDSVADGCTSMIGQAPKRPILMAIRAYAPRAVVSIPRSDTRGFARG